MDWWCGQDRKVAMFFDASKILRYPLISVEICSRHLTSDLTLLTRTANNFCSHV